VANMSFPNDYPNKPPTVKFVSEMWHPNVYPDGGAAHAVSFPAQMPAVGVTLSPVQRKCQPLQLC